VAISEITKQIRLRSKEFPETKPLDYHRYLVISLGTGLPEQDIKFDALHVAKWGFFEWLGRHFTMPLLHMFLHASSDMTDSHVANLFKSIGCSDQLLRIQVDIPCVTSQCQHSQFLSCECMLKSIFIYCFAGPQHTNSVCVSWPRNREESSRAG